MIKICLRVGGREGKRPLGYIYLGTVRMLSRYQSGKSRNRPAMFTRRPSEHHGKAPSCHKQEHSGPSATECQLRRGHDAVVARHPAGEGKKRPSNTRALHYPSTIGDEEGLRGGGRGARLGERERRAEKEGIGVQDTIDRDDDAKERSGSGIVFWVLGERESARGLGIPQYDAKELG